MLYCPAILLPGTAHKVSGLISCLPVCDKMPGCIICFLSFCDPHLRGTLVDTLLAKPGVDCPEITHIHFFCHHSYTGFAGNIYPKTCGCKKIRREMDLLASCHSAFLYAHGNSYTRGYHVSRTGTGYATAHLRG